jgi:hypothetical protein
MDVSKGRPHRMEQPRPFKGKYFTEYVSEPRALEAFGLAQDAEATLLDSDVRIDQSPLVEACPTSAIGVWTNIALLAIIHAWGSAS